MQNLKCAAKTVRVRFLVKAYFIASAVFPISSRFPGLRYRLVIQNWRLHCHSCVKSDDDPISSLDFSFIGGVPLKRVPSGTILTISEF